VVVDPIRIGMLRHQKLHRLAQDFPKWFVAQLLLSYSPIASEKLRCDERFEGGMHEQVAEYIGHEVTLVGRSWIWNRYCATSRCRFCLLSLKSLQGTL
jgi:hypothetical protein